MPLLFSLVFPALLVIVMIAMHTAMLSAAVSLRLELRPTHVRLRGADGGAMATWILWGSAASFVLWVVGCFAGWDLRVSLACSGALLLASRGCRFTFEVGRANATLVRRVFWVVPWRSAASAGQPLVFVDGYDDWDEVLLVSVGDDVPPVEVAWTGRNWPTTEAIVRAFMDEVRRIRGRCRSYRNQVV